MRSTATRVRGLATHPLVRSSFWVISGSALAQAFGFLYWLIAARRFPAEAVGFITAAGSAMTLSALLVSAGMPPFLLRVLPVSGPRVHRRVALTLAWCTLAPAAAAALLAVALGAANSPVLLCLTILGAAATGAALAGDAIATAARAAGLVPLRTLIASAGKTLLLFAPLPLLGLPYGTTAGVAGWAAAMTASALWQLWQVRSPLREMSLLPSHPIPPPLRAAFANHGIAIGQQLPLLALPLIATATLGASTAGVLYVPWFVGVALAGIPVLIAGVLLTEGARSENDVPKLLQRTLRLYAVVLGPPVILVAAFSAPLLALFGEEYRVGAPLLTLVAVSTVPTCAIALTVSVWRIRHTLARAATLCLASGIAATLAMGLSLHISQDFTTIGVYWLGIQSITAVICIPTLIRGWRPVTAA